MRVVAYCDTLMNGEDYVWYCVWGDKLPPPNPSERRGLGDVPPKTRMRIGRVNEC